jgi:hypothetical protein
MHGWMDGWMMMVNIYFSYITTNKKKEEGIINTARPPKKTINQKQTKEPSQENNQQPNHDPTQTHTQHRTPTTLHCRHER